MDDGSDGASMLGDMKFIRNMGAANLDEGCFDGHTSWEKRMKM